jgi:hypothetical protein
VRRSAAGKDLAQWLLPADAQEVSQMIRQKLSIIIFLMNNRGPALSLPQLFVRVSLPHALKVGVEASEPTNDLLAGNG